MATTAVLDTTPKTFRAGVSRGLSNTHAVERDGGDYGAGIIRGASMITHGPALGHGMWVDRDMVAQTVDFANEKPKGLKVRFAHPGMSSDGLGKLTARAKNARLSSDGEKAFADLHIVESSRNTPDGDLGEYVMNLAEQDADMFGTSIVFQRDFESEQEFENEHLEEVEVEDYRGRPVKRMRFKSPDPSNEDDMPHARIAELGACDVVDEPAANPDGLFHRESSDIAAQATELIEYCFGLRDDSSSFSGIDPDRAKQFVNRFLDNQELEVVPKMTTTTQQPESEAVNEFEDRKKTAAIYKNKFGEELGAQYFCDGLTLTEAADAFQAESINELNAKIDSLTNQIEMLQEENTGLKAQLSAAQAGVVGETEALDTGDTGESQGETKKKGVIRFADDRN